MADLELRAFGRRFFMVYERTGRVRTAAEEADKPQPPPATTYHHAGDFTVADSQWWYPRTEPDLFGFQPPPRDD